jgi:hypothetical protein
VDTGNILFVGYQMAAIAVSIALLYGIRNFMSRPIEGDEEKRATMEKARALRREARQRSLEVLMGLSQADLYPNTDSMLTMQGENTGLRTVKEKRSGEKEVPSSMTELTGSSLLVNRETEERWEITQGCW